MKPTKKLTPYQKKLLDPRWQKKRLETLQRDEWRCQSCGDKESTLHVHHTAYFPGCDPWDYPDILLITLCSDCHSAEHVVSHAWLTTDLAEVVDALRGKGFLMADIESILWDIEAVGIRSEWMKRKMVEKRV